MNDRLYRSRDDRMLAGVAAGLADYWDADPSLIRVIWALLVILTGGIALVVYIVMAIIVPEDPMPFGMAPGAFGAPGAPIPPAPWGPPPGPGSAPAGPATGAPMGSYGDAAAPAGPTSGPDTAPPVAAPYPMPPNPWVSAGSYPMDPRSARRAARDARRAARRAHGGGLGAVMFGIILVLVGAFFLAREWIPQLDFDWFWPVILIAVGVVTLVAAFARPHDESVFR